MEYMFGSMEIDIRGNSSNVLKMDKGLKNLQMEISTKASIPKASQMAMENTTGRMAATSKELSKMG